MDAEVWLDPVDAAVEALGVECDLTFVILPPAIAPVRSRDFVAAVIQAELFTIFQDSGVVSERPGRHPSEAMGFVHSEHCAVESPDDQVIDKEFAARADIDGLRALLSGQRPDKNRPE